MPNYFTGHIDKWLLLSEAETDFAILFVRAWIPFNAWYCNNYNDTSDRRCLDKIKTDTNQFRAKLIALLRGHDSEAEKFRAFLKDLHLALNQHPIPDAGPDRISFENIYFRKNPKTVTAPLVKKRNIEYKCELLSDNNVSAIAINTRKNPQEIKHNYRHTKYDLENFQNDLNSKVGNKEIRDTLLELFQEINPKRKENLIRSNKKNSLIIDNVFFVHDVELLSQAIIEIIYQLRCKLFHGELQPSKNNLSVYEPAYNLLRILLKSLK